MFDVNLRGAKIKAMDIVIDLIKILIPAGLVLYAMYLVVKSFLNKQNESQIIELRSKNKEIILPLRLQAYERMCLFLERCSPEQLVARLQKADQNVAELQFLMLHELREEFNHNLSQQVYMSHEAWESVKTAKEEMIMLINQSAKNLNPEDKSMQLVKTLFELRMNNEQDSLSYSLRLLKEEIQAEF